VVGKRQTTTTKKAAPVRRGGAAEKWSTEVCMWIGGSSSAGSPLSSAYPYPIPPRFVGWCVAVVFATMGSRRRRNRKSRRPTWCTSLTDAIARLL
jgi:hypothetical protein